LANFMVQGFSCVLTGLIGSGNATTAYNENIGGVTGTACILTSFPRLCCTLTIPVSLVLTCLLLPCSYAADKSGEQTSHPGRGMHCHRDICHR
jgi:uncharacterized protein YceK